MDKKEFFETYEMLKEEKVDPKYMLLDELIDFELMLEEEQKNML